MGERILGPAYPALLAPGLRVVGIERDDATGEELLHDCIVIGSPERVGRDDVPGATIVPTVYGPVINGRRAMGPWLLETLRIDYADPHTRDRVIRALAAHLRPGDDIATQCPRVDWILECATGSLAPGAWDAWLRRMDLRGVAAAVWGGR